MIHIPKVILQIETSRAVGRRLLRGIVKYSNLHGPWAFYRELPFYKQDNGTKHAPVRMKTWGANGLITRQPEKAKRLIKSGLATVIAIDIKKPIGSIPRVITDYEAIGKMGAEYLLNLGLKHFAYCGFADRFWSRDRGESFANWILKAGYKIGVYEQPCLKIENSWGKEQTLMAKWLQALPKPVGVMTCNDDYSQYVIEACKIAELHVPDEIAILGIDNDEMVCDLSNPPLSSIALSTERAGYKAAELLYKLMNGEEITNHEIIVKPTHVVTRQSTNVLATKDLVVAEAIRFIRANANKPICVDDVVNFVAMSKRGLYQKFSRYLGHTVHDEITRTRVERMVRMLVETEMSISQIAFEAGFSGVDHIARYFKKQIGITPRQYRLRYKSK